MKNLKHPLEAFREEVKVRKEVEVSALSVKILLLNVVIVGLYFLRYYILLFSSWVTINILLETPKDGEVINFFWSTYVFPMSFFDFFGLLEIHVLVALVIYFVAFFALRSYFLPLRKSLSKRRDDLEGMVRGLC